MYSLTVVLEMGGRNNSRHDKGPTEANLTARFRTDRSRTSGTGDVTAEPLFGRNKSFGTLVKD